MTTFTTEDRIAAEEDEVVPIPFAGMVSLKPFPKAKSLEDLARDESDKLTWTCPQCSDVIPSDKVHTCMSSSTHWTHSEAVELCILIEAVCPQFGCHVALTGGSLYKAGERKDCDILFYRIRQVDEIDQDGLFRALSEIGIEWQRGFGWVHKAKFQGKRIDMFFPEADDGEYQR